MGPLAFGLGALPSWTGLGLEAGAAPQPLCGRVGSSMCGGLILRRFDLSKSKLELRAVEIEVFSKLYSGSLGITEITALHYPKIFSFFNRFYLFIFREGTGGR